MKVAPDNPFDPIKNIEGDFKGILKGWHALHLILMLVRICGDFKGILKATTIVCARAPWRVTNNRIGGDFKGILKEFGIKRR